VCSNDVVSVHAGFGGMRAGILRHCRLHMELGKKEQTHGNNIHMVVSARRDRGNVNRGGPKAFWPEDKGVLYMGEANRIA